MPQASRILAALALLGALLFTSGCNPECVDTFDCRGRGTGYVCQENRCVVGTPTVDAGADAGTCNPACSGNKPYCNVVRALCVQCLLNSQCPDEQPICDVATNTCAALPDGGAGDAGIKDGGTADGGDAGGFQGFDAGPVDASVPLNDDCSGVVTLTFDDAGVAKGSGTTVFALNSSGPFVTTLADGGLNDAGFASPSCSTSARNVGRDVVYKYNLPSPTSVRVTVSPTDARGFNPVVYLRRANLCASPDPASEAACSGPQSGQNILSITSQPAGEYYVWVDGNGGTSGSFDLEVAQVAAPVAPQNETCATAQALVFDGGTAVAFSDTTLAVTNNGAADPTPTCSGTARAGPDVVYTFELTQASSVKITVTPLNPGYRPSFYVRKPTLCTSALAADELTCGLGANLGLPASAQLANLPAGIYPLWVDSSSGTKGPFKLEVSVAAPILPPPNETCATAQNIVFPAGQDQVTFQVNTVAALDDHAGSCNATADSPEAVYHLNLTAPKDVYVKAVTAPGFAVDSVIWMRKGGCAADAGIEVPDSCADEAPAVPEEVELLNLDPGDYYLYVEGFGRAGAGPTDVTVQVSPPTVPVANDTCATAADLTLPANLSGSTRNAKDDVANPTCAASTTGNDVVYKITTTTAQRLTAKVTALPGRHKLNPLVYLRDTLANCSAKNGDGSLGCITGGAEGASATLVVSNLAAGTHYLIVDGANGSKGDFTLDVKAEAVAGAPANDTCAAPAALPLTNGSASASGTTLGAMNDATLVCSPGSGSRPDVVYDVVTPALPAGATAFNLRASVASSNAAELFPAVSIRSTCGMVSSELDCDSSSLAPHEAIAYGVGLAPATHYAVWVDGAGGAGGPFALQVDVAASPAANDSCASTAELANNMSVAGSTLGAADDLSSTGVGTWYTSTTCNELFPGADVVYRYTATATGTVRVTVTPQRGYDVSVALLSSCAQNACVATEDRHLAGEPEVLTFPATQGTTYFLAVDSYYPGTAGYPNSRGGFVIGVSQ